MKIKTVKTSLSNSYIIIDKDQNDNLCAVVIDPALELEEVLEFDVVMCLATHGHADHINNAKLICDHYQIPLFLHKDEAIYAKDDSFNLSHYVIQRPLAKVKDLNLLEDNQELTFLNHTLKVWHTPGHTKGSVMYLLDNHYLFSGDTVFKDAIGRTDLPGSSSKVMSNTLAKLAEIDSDYKVLPGHGMATSFKEVKHQMEYWRRLL